MKKVWQYAPILLVLMLTSATPALAWGRHHHTPQVPPPVITPPSVQNGPVTWGVYTNDTDSGMNALDAQLGTTMTVDPIFWGWDDTFPQATPGMKGKTLLIYWEPSFGYNKINNGTEDAYITAFARGAKSYSGPVILVPFDEFNLNETAWENATNGNTPASFIAAWQRVNNIFKAQGATNVKFGLAYNNVSIPATSFASFYPGDGYVDYVGVDCFNFGGQTFAQACSPALAQIKAVTSKPEWIFSTGSLTPQGQFMKDLKASGYPWIWFDSSPFNITDVNTFKTIVQ